MTAYLGLVIAISMHNVHTHTYVRYAPRLALRRRARVITTHDTFYYDTIYRERLFQFFRRKTRFARAVV